jgi:hypothetical protein
MECLEGTSRSSHPKLRFAWIYEAVNTVLAGVGLSLVPYAEGNRGLCRRGVLQNFE